MGWRSSRPAKADEGRLTFEEFVNASAGRLLRTAVFLVHDRHLAEDLVQSTYERVARRWTRIQRAGGRPEAYARKVLVNLVIDDRKRRARRGDVLVGSVADVDRIAGAATAQDPLRGGLDHALAGLPVRQRAVMVLRYWCDLSEQEIAETLGISRGLLGPGRAHRPAQVDPASGLAFGPARPVHGADHRPREKAVRRTREAAGPVPRDAPGRTVEALGWAACGRQ